MEYLSVDVWVHLYDEGKIRVWNFYPVLSEEDAYKIASETIDEHWEGKGKVTRVITVGYIHKPTVAIRKPRS